MKNSKSVKSKQSFTIFSHFFRARLKNVDRNSATYHSVTVDDFTVVITEFKPKVKKEKKDADKNKNTDKDNDKNW